MSPSLWKQKIGDRNWGMLLQTLKDAYAHEVEIKPNGEHFTDEDRLAAVLTKASTIGLQVPERVPVVNAAGTKLLWPSTQITQAALTAQGMLNYYARRGHGWFILRMPQLMRACTPMGMLARLQEILALYEQQCYDEEIPPLPIVGGHTWRVFVGGKHEHAGIDLLARLVESSPRPEPDAIKRVTAKGPVGRAL